MPLSDSDLEKWDYKAHTKVKHGLLEKYVIGWLRYLSKFGKVCIFDCFAGRGEYKKGEEGSPIIILDCVGSCTNLLNEVVCIFIEKNPDNFKNLERVLDQKNKSDPKKYEKIKIIVKNDEFANIASEIIEEVGERLAPSFFFIDPFGFSGIPFNIIKNILSKKHTEVFITFMTRDINRFLSDSRKINTLNELFGTKKWEEISKIENSADRENKLRDLYIEQLKNEAKFVRVYRVNMDEVKQTVYYLIHATNHFKGFKLMTDIMWKQSTSGGMFAFLGPDEGQLRLCDFGSNISSLKKFLLDKFSKRTLSFWEIMEECYKNLDCIEQHYRTALKELLKEGKIKREPEFTRRGKPRTGIDQEDKITFLF